MSDNCPHCGHGWSYHTSRCTTCGCLWKKPKPPPAPPTAQEVLIAKVRDAIFDELDHQHEAGEIDGAGYWDREWGCCDGEPNWSGVAAAAIAAAQT